MQQTGKHVFWDGQAKWERVEQTSTQWLAHHTEVPGSTKVCHQRRGQ